MAKTQTITIKKTGSNWASADECYTELNEHIDSTEWVVQYKSIMNNKEITEADRELDFNITTQTLVEIISWSDEALASHKSNITSISTALENNLQDNGWIISEKIENSL